MGGTAKETKEKIRLELGDITESDCEAIVNAANNDLQLGAGVAGAIRRQGGPAIQDECDRVGPIALGDAAITTGGNLKARHVIHAASMQLGGRTSEADLRSSIRRSLQIADREGLKSLALPAVGAGIAGFPLGRCARVMMEVACDHLAAGSRLERIVFVLFDQRAYDAFREVYDRL